MRIGAFIVAGLLLAGTAAAADGVKAIVAQRQAALKDQGKTMKMIGDALKGGLTDRPAVVAAARHLDELAHKLPDGFPPGSGAAAGVKTAAKDDIWSRPDEFRRDAADFAAAADQLAAMAPTASAEALSAQFRKVGGTCGACHKVFRQKDTAGG